MNFVSQWRHKIRPVPKQEVTARTPLSLTKRARKDVTMEILYKGKAVAVKDDKQTIKALFKAIIFCVVVFAVAKHLPFSWVFEIGAIVLSAIYINKVLKQGTFIATYILYEDSLAVVTRYGFIEKETARYILSESEFTENSVTTGGKTYPFYPDEELKKFILK